jgi:uroporphyrinogen decarboxylase
LRSAERVFLTLEHNEPDYVPLTDHIYMAKSLEGILGEKGVRTNTPEKYVRVHRLLGLDLICAFSNGPEATIVKPETTVSAKETVDEWGIKYREIDGMAWYLEGPIKTIDDFERYVPPDPSLPERVKTAKEIVRLVKGDMAIAGIVGGPFTTSWLLSGFDLFAKSVYANSKGVQKLLQALTKFAIGLGEIFIEAGVDMIWIPDDLGTVDGPFLSPNTFRRMIFLYFNEIVDSFKKRGMKVLLHCDGQVMPLVDDLIEMGMDGLHPIERKAGMNLAEVKAKYGDKLTLIGNVDATEVLPHGTEEDIKRQVIECLKTAAPGGGYILASDHSIHEGVPSENAKTMFKLAKKYGKYPIKLH